MNSSDSTSSDWLERGVCSKAENGAHSQGASVDELLDNLREVVAMLLEEGEPRLEAEFVGTHTIQVT